jgi:hypothetical protein
MNKPENPNRFSPTPLELHCQIAICQMETKVHRAIILQILGQNGTIDNKSPEEWIKEQTKQQVREWFRQLADLHPAEATELSRIFESWQEGGSQIGL